MDHIGPGEKVPEEKVPGRKEEAGRVCPMIFLKMRRKYAPVGQALLNAPKEMGDKGVISVYLG